MLRCEGLTLAVPGRVLARGVGFEVRRGESWAVLGPNGSGKTTLLHALAGLSPPAAGTVTLDGVRVAGRGAAARAALIGVLLQQEDAAFWGSLADYVLLGRYPHARGRVAWSCEDEEAARRALETVELSEFARRAYRTLSGGERQRGRIAQVLAQDPRVFLLDEPLQHLDLRHQAAAMRLFGRLAGAGGRAVVMVLHDVLWPAYSCTHALFLHGDGMVESGPARELLVRGRLERLYGCRLRELADGGMRLFAPIL